MNRLYTTEHTKGLLVSLLITVLAIIAAKYSPSFLNSVMWALLIGILLRNTLKLPEDWESGISFTSAKMLELSIIFLAFGIDYSQIAALGAMSFLGIVITVFLVLLATYFLAKKFNCPTNTGLLVGFGTAICGSSAIAALAPTLKNGEKEDVAISMAVVNLLGTVAMMVMPLVLIKLMWTDADMGYLVGGSLHSVGNVAGAGFAMSKEAGDIAITVKLARVALLTPGLILMSYLNNRREQSDAKWTFQIPWYLIGFILITVLVSWVEIPKDALKLASITGNVILTMAMAAIGLKVNFKKLVQSGKRGMRFGVVIFAWQMAVLLAVLWVLRTL
jgi:uncharacterized integral membrane protein (TIGR00698 family)